MVRINQIYMIFQLLKVIVSNLFYQEILLNQICADIYEYLFNSMRFKRYLAFYHLVVFNFCFSNQNIFFLLTNRRNLKRSFSIKDIDLLFVLTSLCCLVYDLAFHKSLRLKLQYVASMEIFSCFLTVSPCEKYSFLVNKDCNIK